MEIISTLLKCDLKNNNGCVYDCDALKNAIDKYTEDGSPILGCINRPNYNEPLKLADVSHKVIDVDFIESGEVKCNIELLNTPMGKIAQEFIKNGGVHFEPTFDSFGNLRSIDLMSSNYGK